MLHAMTKIELLYDIQINEADLRARLEDTTIVRMTLSGVAQHVLLRWCRVFTIAVFSHIYRDDRLGGFRLVSHINYRRG
jgi:hypothetical protein